MKKNKSFYIMIGLILITLLVLTGCGNGNVDSNTPGNEIEEGNGEDNEDTNDEETNLGEEDNPSEDEMTQGFSLIDIDGNTVALSDFKGRPVVLSFWVSWNEYSIKQLETLRNVYPLLHGDVVFLAINATSFETKNGNELINYIKNKDLGFNILIDSDGEATQSYYVGGFPTTFFINESGKTTKMFTSNIEEDQLLDEVELLLEGY